MLADLTLKALLERTAEGTPVPGGGSQAAMAAAVGAALAQMVAHLTAGRHQFADVDQEMRTLAEKAQKLRGELLSDMDRDAAAYTAVMQAFRLPRKTAEDEQRRTDAIQAALQHAAQVPLAVAENALAVMELAQAAVRLGNPNAASDGAVGALLARAALQGACFNVRINLQGIHNQAFVERLGKMAAALADRAATLEKEILAAIAF